jgi:hypothetical protein
MAQSLIIAFTLKCRKSFVDSEGTNLIQETAEGIPEIHSFEKEAIDCEATIFVRYVARIQG